MYYLEFLDNFEESKSSEKVTKIESIIRLLHVGFTQLTNASYVLIVCSTYVINILWTIFMAVYGRMWHLNLFCRELGWSIKIKLSTLDEAYLICKNLFYINFIWVERVIS